MEVQRAKHARQQFTAQLPEFQRITIERAISKPNLQFIPLRPVIAIVIALLHIIVIRTRNRFPIPGRESGLASRTRHAPPVPLGDVLQLAWIEANKFRKPLLRLRQVCPSP